MSDHFAPPRENLCRGPAAFEWRELDSGSPTLVGHFAVFNQWTEINSMFEGNFMERIEPGSFAKTFEGREKDIQVLFNHGNDPELGDKVIGDIQVLREDDEGGYYEAALFDGLPRLLMEGLRAGKYGASMRFRVTRELLDAKPKKSAHNPEGLPERSIKEVDLSEFGPVTFPAYKGATAGIRSLTDQYLLGTLVRDKTRLRDLIRDVEGEPSEPDAVTDPDPDTSGDVDAARGSVPGTSHKVHEDLYLSMQKEEPSWTLSTSSQASRS